MITPELIAQLRAALEIIGDLKIGPPGGITGFGKHFRYIYSDGISIRVSGDNSNVVAESVLTLRNHAPALLDEIERLREENALQHSQLLEQAINVLPERDAEIERLREENARLNRCFDRQQEIANEAQTELAKARARVAELEEEVEVEEYKICSNCKYEELQSTLEPCDSCVGEEYPGWEPKEYTQ